MANGDGASTTEKAIARNEAVLMEVRNEALHSLLDEGRAATFTGQARLTGKGLEVDLNNGQKDSKLIAAGKTTDEHRLIDFSGFHFDQHMKGDVEVTRIQDGKHSVTHDIVDISSGDYDAWMGRTDKFTVSMQRQDANGKPIQSYEPAVSEPKIVAGMTQLDPNGQPVRLARTIGDSVNCQAENPANPGNHRQLCEFMIDDPQLGKLSFNLTREKVGDRFYNHGVVRKLDGTVKAITEENGTYDRDGNLMSLNFSIREPRKPR